VTADPKTRTRESIREELASWAAAVEPAGAGAVAVAGPARGVQAAAGPGAGTGRRALQRAWLAAGQAREGAAAGGRPGRATW
jgi:hypothetical protein